MLIVDSLSRASIDNVNCRNQSSKFSEELAILEKKICNLKLIASLQATDIIQQAARDDDQFRQLKGKMLFGWSENVNDFPDILIEYNTFAVEFAISEA